MIATLKAVCSELHSGKSIPASEISKEGRYPVIGGNGLRGYTSQYNFDGECAVIGRQGAACGNVRYHSGKAYMTEHAVIACANEDNDSRYLAYLLSTADLGRLSAQSAQPGLSVKTLGNQVFDLPSYQTQKKVAALLGSLDNKIETNRRINDYLAALIRLEFDRRFSRETPTIDLGDVMSISTQSIKPNDHIGEIWEHYSIPAYDEMHRPIFELADGIKSNKYVIDSDCILVSKLNPSTKRLWLPRCTSKTSVCSTEFIVYRPKKVRYKSFYYAAIDSETFFAFLLSHVTGSTGSRQRSQPKATLNYPIPNPDAREIEDFCEFADPLIAQQQSNEQETDDLIRLRDTLLPKLISGELNIDKIV